MTSVSGVRDVAEPAGALTAATAVGTVSELWLYPVKSMLGERTRELRVTPLGGLGDRAWALRELDTGRIASAKKYPRLLEFRARYEVEPTAASPGRVRIEAPDGRELFADDEDASQIISAVLGKPLRLESRPGTDEKTGIDRGSVFGDVPVSELQPDWTPETMPDYFQLMSGSFKEIGALFLVTSGSIQHLRALQGGTALVDRRRFRPNVYIDSGTDAGAFVEDSWIGGTLAVGDEVRLDEFQPTLWCVTSTLAQEELPRDLSILRTAAEHHKGCLGVYGSVRSAGLVRVGDTVLLST
jgi:MOSC domain-containing protein